MTIVGLDHVPITARPGCEGDARRFNGDTLGMREIPKPEKPRGGVACALPGGPFGNRVEIRAP